MSRLDLDSLHHLLRWCQDGVVSRRQVLGFGGDDNDIERMLRRRILTAVAPGVYVDHTGRLSQAQKEWVAVLSCWPAALAHEAALPLPPLDAVQVAVAVGRRLRSTERIRVVRTHDFAQRVDPMSSPPRIRVEHATIDVMSKRITRGDLHGAYTVLADVCQSRRTTPAKILAVLGERGRVAGRATIQAMLADLRDGACSVLERGYLQRVERAHGLPRAVRQRRSRATGRRTDQDICYEQFGVVIELDGRAFHDTAAGRDRDARRDLAELAVAGALTARITYGMVFSEACSTAASVGALLRSRGWRDEFRRCPDCPRDLPVP